MACQLMLCHSLPQKAALAAQLISSLRKRSAAADLFWPYHSSTLLLLGNLSLVQLTIEVCLLGCFLESNIWRKYFATRQQGVLLFFSKNYKILCISAIVTPP